MIGTGELIIIFLVVLLLFGGKRLPELAKSLGAGIREFKRACSDSEGKTEKISKADESSDQ
jgi:sec-independent protein translocase protein TatA